MLDWEEARRLALALPGTEEHLHFGAASFKAGRKIFAVLREPGLATIGLDPEDQANLMAVHPDLLRPVAGKSGKAGWTYLDLTACDEAIAGRLLRLAWSGVAPRRFLGEDG